MLKHYIKWQVKQWWPLLLIFGTIMTLSFVSTVLNSGVGYEFNEYTVYYPLNNSVSGYLLSIFLPAFVMTLVMPIFVYSYRVRKQSADVFYQAPYKKGEIKRVRILIGLAICLVATTVAFWTGAFIHGIRHATAPMTVERQYWGIVEKAPLYWGYYFYGYLAIMLFVAAHYFINCFLAGLGDYRLDQVFLLLFGNIAFSLFFTAPMLYGLNLVSLCSGEISSWAFASLLYGFGPVGGIGFAVSVVENLLLGGVENTAIVVTSYISFANVILFAGFLGFMEMRNGDPSAEHADTRGPRNNLVALIPHGAAATIGILIAMLPTTGLFGFGFIGYFMFLMFGAIYYVFLSLWRHNFRMAQLDRRVFILVNTMTFFLMLVTTIVDAIVMSMA